MTWREVVKKDCQAHKLNKENAMDRSKWRSVKDKGCPMIRMGVRGRIFLLVLAYPGSPRSKAVKRVCVCVFLSPNFWPFSSFNV